MLLSLRDQMVKRASFVSESHFLYSDDCKVYCRENLDPNHSRIKGLNESKKEAGVS